jgi:uncharacterized protein
MDVETDAELIKLLAERKEEENWRFRAFLKDSTLSTAGLDGMVAEHLAAVTAKIDCCACANCCRVMSPTLSGRDLRRLADHLRLSRAKLISDHLRPAEDKDTYIFKQTPCPFLRDQRCDVYDARPDACRSFPHLQKREFRSRLTQVVENCSICPIVFNVFERLKTGLWRGGRRRW